jgi:transposase
MGRSRSGLTNKIHAEVDRNGLPARLALSACEAHDNRPTGKLWFRLKSGTMLLADRGYDTDWIRALAAKRGVWANIPSKCNLICLSPYLYRARNLVERFVSNILQCRRVATCYDKLVANYLAFIQLAPIRLWLRISESTPSLARQKRRRAELRKNLLGLGSDPPRRYRPSFHRQRSGPARNRRYHRSRSLIPNDREPNVAELTKRFTLMIIGVGRAGNAWIRRLPRPRIYLKDVPMYLLTIIQVTRQKLPRA